jgi:hypothetical protein
MNFKEFLLTERTTATRYSVEVNYRTKIKEVLQQHAKIVLGYVSAALKQNGYHIKQVFEDEPIRILVSTRNFEEGEWVGFLIFKPENGGKFQIAQGFYNRDRRTVSLQSWKDSKGDSPADLAAEMRNVMHELKSRQDRHLPKLKPVPLKRGPKR